jgi:hypothetical protein
VKCEELRSGKHNTPHTNKQQHDFLNRDTRRIIVSFLETKEKVYFASCSTECFNDVAHIQCWKDSETQSSIFHKS